MTDTSFRAPMARVLLALAALALHAAAWGQLRVPQAERSGERAAARAADRSATRNGDYIVAIVNQELVTAVEVERRVARARDEGARARARLPPADELRRQVVDSLIEERAILTYAREQGARVDEAELDRAVQAVAAQNQLTLAQLRDRLRRDGVDFDRFRANLRDQILVERTREREVYQRIRVTDGEVDRQLDQQRSAAAADPAINVAQILVTVPEGAAEPALAERRARAESALARVKGGEAFDAVARELSEDGNRERGGEIGLRPTSRLPDLFVAAVKDLKPGQVAQALLRSGAGFHVLKLIDRQEAGAPRVTQTRVRHILLRPGPQTTAALAQARLADVRRQIESGARTFEDAARQVSEDGSAAQGGDLGWMTPGTLVPEFEEAMNRLPVGGLSEPVASRFGMHLIAVTERREVPIEPKQLRELARNAIREQKFEEAYVEWVRDLRARAYVEMREPPQ
jgi:peptidyl-prolyl cis-trans isomerase SurA